MRDGQSVSQSEEYDNNNTGTFFVVVESPKKETKRKEVEQNKKKWSFCSALLLWFTRRRTHRNEVSLSAMTSAVIVRGIGNRIARCVFMKRLEKCANVKCGGGEGFLFLLFFSTQQFFRSSFFFSRLYLFLLSLFHGNASSNSSWRRRSGA